MYSVSAYNPISMVVNAAVTTSSTGATTTAVDMATYASLAAREVMVVALPGTMTTCATCTFTVEECDTTNGTYSAPVAGTTTSVITSTQGAAGTAVKMPVAIQKRYVHLKYTLDTTGSMPLAAVLFAALREANS